MANDFIPKNPYYPTTIETEVFVAKEPREISKPGASIPVVVVSTVNDTFSSTKEGIVKHTTWYELKFFGKNAEAVLKSVSKGAVLLVRGRLSFNTYVSEDGVEHRNNEILIDKFGISPVKGNGGNLEGGSGGSDSYASGQSPAPSQGRGRSSGGEGRGRGSRGSSGRGTTGRGRGVAIEDNDVDDLIQDIDL